MNIKREIERCTTGAEKRDLLRRAREVLRRESKKFDDRPRLIPRHAWPRENVHCTAVWRSKAFLIQFYQQGPWLRMSVNRAAIDDTGDWTAGISWDDLQAIKCQTGFEDRQMIEIYPTAADVVNVANIRHLWLAPEGMELPSLKGNYPA